MDESDGMPQHGVLTLDNLRQVRPAFLTRRITMLGPARMREVCDALPAAVDC